MGLPGARVDVMNCVLMSICVGLGFYAWSKGMDMQWLMYWGMMCLMNGIYALISCLQRSLDGTGLTVSFPGLPPLYLILGFFYEMALPAYLGGSILCYYLYQEHQAECYGPVNREAMSGRWGNDDNSTRQANETTYLIGGVPQQVASNQAPAFQAFSGEGRRLGAEQA